MFCCKCGKEIADEAIICPMCGCATINYHQPATPAQQHTNDHLAIKQFESSVKGVHTLSVLSAIFFLGIGIIFSIAASIKAKAIIIPNITTQNPVELADYAEAKRKLKNAINISIIPIFPLTILACVLMLYSIAAGFLTLAILMLIVLLCRSCTKHLDDLLKSI